MNIGKQAAETGIYQNDIPATDVTSIEDAARKWSYQPGPAIEVKEGTVELGSVHLGRLEIRKIGGAPAWGCEVLLDGEPVKQLRRFTLSCGVDELVTLAMEVFV